MTKGHGQIVKPYLYLGECDCQDTTYYLLIYAVMWSLFQFQSFADHYWCLILVPKG